MGHGIDEKLVDDMLNYSRTFFALPVEVKQRISMSQAGVAMRGFFPVGGELTSGRADQKEGLYMGLDYD